ncbi:hypothetical protein [Streptomyces rimosus]|uniref:hypothetical protein n=1 Tax=Streptomyces rimosus TaxID=1927 RepID=UPI0004C914F2|nr:hypothetical protein [Streptomyces rimosus]
MSKHHMRAPLQTALAAWRQARSTASSGAPPRRTGVAYHLAVNRLQLYASMLRGGPRPREEVRDELSATCHALSVLCRESVPKVAASGAAHYVAVHARTGLAAAHLADPARGEPGRVGAALDGPLLERFDPDGAGDVPPAERIAAAADVRLLLASVIADRPPARGATGAPWRISEDAGSGFRAVYRDRRRFRRAVLPSCAGLEPQAEALRLGGEGVRLHAALAAVLPGHRTELASAQRQLAELSRLFGVAAPTVE